MIQQSVSIADIARAAGVSHSTVSRALRDSPLISDEVRQRIQRMAQEMGYTPNSVAQSLQTKRTNTIGLVVTSIADPFLTDVMDGVEEVARPAGFSVFLTASHNDPDQEMAAIETFHRRRVDGVLVAASRIGSLHMERLRQMRVPTVLINSQAEGDHELLHSVTVDDQVGARTAVEHLVGLGHRAIGYLAAANRPVSNQRRLAGYRAALQSASVASDEGWVVAPPNHELYEDDVALGQAALPALIDSGVSAVFCYNDMLAIGVLAACREHGIAVPEQVSVVGFDDIRLARYVTPTLTTVCQPKHELGRLAMGTLLDLLDGRPARNHVVLPTLVQRDSTTFKLPV